LRSLRPKPAGSAHRRCPLWASPPGIVDVVAGPYHQGCDLGGVGLSDEGVALHEAGRLALGLAIAIQESSRLVNLVGLGPMMGENTDHATPRSFVDTRYQTVAPPNERSPKGSPGSQRSHAFSCRSAGGCVDCRPR